VETRADASPVAADDAHARFLAAARFPSLDGLRCLAIVPVVWHHATPRPLPGLLGKGPLGVDLFFAISGLLITTLLLRERRATGTIALGRFYARRSLRIFPLYYLVLGLYALRAWLLLDPSPMRAHFVASLPFYATYTANWLVDFDVPHPVIFAFAWSLATEEQFYLVWPPLLRVARSRLVAAAAMSAAVVVDLAAERGALASVLPPGSLALRVVTSFAVPIGLGALAAIALDAPRSFALARATLGRRASAPLALAGLAALVAWDGAPLLAVHAAMTALVAACVIRPDHGLARLLDGRAVRHVGAVSYGVYLVHVSMITAAKALLPRAAPTAAIFAIALGASIALATVSFRTIEAPLLRLRERLRARSKAMPDVAAPLQASDGTT
jgi:peptidoglycan/LPS O-acetylase OafA/YrhL